MKEILNLAKTDFKLIFRDPTLWTFFILPGILFLLFLYVVPYLIVRFPQMEAYLPLILAVAVIENTQLFSFICSMILIDEKETKVSKTYGVIPMSKSFFILGRFIFPVLITLGINVLFLLIQPFYTLSVAQILFMALIMSMIVPLYALCINVMADNRIQAMVYIKAANMLVLIPFAAYFVPNQLKHVFGVLPTHWTLQYSVGIFAQEDNNWTLWVALVYLMVSIWLTSKVFFKKHFN